MSGGVLLKFQGITQHVLHWTPGILAQVQRDQVLIASKGRCESSAQQRSDGTSPQPVGETHTFTDLLNQCLTVYPMCQAHTWVVVVFVVRVDLGSSVVHYGGD